MVPFLVPIIIRHLLFRVPKRDHNFDNHPDLKVWALHATSPEDFLGDALTSAAGKRPDQEAEAVARGCMGLSGLPNPAAPV